MVLRDHFEQRKIEATFSSFRSMLPLTTPSGPQQVESELEAELLEQLAFSPGVYDLLTQPIIDYTLDGEPRRYTPDIAVQLHASGDDAPCRYLIEVKLRNDLQENASKYALKFEIGRLAAEAAGAAFRIMDETRIKTPYLKNARLLRRHLDADPETEVLDVLQQVACGRTLSIAEAIKVLGNNGMAEPDARAGIEQCAAWRLILCDFSQPFNDATLITAREPGMFSDRDDDPLLKSLFESDSA